MSVEVDTGGREGFVTETEQAYSSVLPNSNQSHKIKLGQTVAGADRNSQKDKDLSEWARIRVGYNQFTGC